MKKTILLFYSITLCLWAWTLATHAQNICIEYGPHPGPWSCVGDGSIDNVGTLNITHIDACVGETIVKPTFATSPTFPDQLKSRTLTYDCSGPQTQTAPVAYLPRILYFEDEQGNLMPDVFNLPVSKTYTAKVKFVPSPLAGWWPAEDNANDVVFQNHGIVQGGLTFGAGKVGQGFVFSTSTAHVRVPANPNLNVGANGLTIEAWIKPSDLSKRNPIVEWNNGTGLFGVHFYILGPAEFNLGPGNLFLSLTDTSGEHHWMHAPGGSVTTSEFRHVAATYNKATGVATIYTNGMMAAQGNFGGITLQTRYDLYLGRRPSGDGIFNYSGLMDEVSIYNCTLSQGDIQNIYNAGTAGIAGKGKCKDGSPAGCATLPAGCVCDPVIAPVGPVTVTVRAKPSITLGGATLEVVRGGAPKFVAENATFTDADSVNFNGGKLIVEFPVESRMSGDVLSITNQGIAAGQIGIIDSETIYLYNSGPPNNVRELRVLMTGESIVTYGNSRIGTYSGGNGGQPLVVTFDSTAATIQAVQALLQSVMYQCISSKSPPTSPRPLNFSITDGPVSTGCSSPVVSKNINITCADGVEVVLLIDRSTSTAGGTLFWEKTAAQFFLTYLRNSVDKVGVIAFCGKDEDDGTGQDFPPGKDEQGNPVRVLNPQRMTPLTSVLATANNAIGDIVNYCDGAVYYHSLNLARTDLSSANDALKVIILLTDDGLFPYDNATTTEGFVIGSLAAAASARAAGIRVITIGLDDAPPGNQAHQTLLRQMASSSGDSYLTDEDHLIDVFSSIAQTICSGPFQVNAGTDQFVVLNTPASSKQTTLAGSVSPAGATVSWQVIGVPTGVDPNGVQFSPANSTHPTVTFPEAGLYQLQLTATLSSRTASDIVEVRLVPNQPSKINAGPDRQIPFGASASLTGIVSDDGLPVGRILDVRWTSSSPGAVTFDDDTDLMTIAHFTVRGVYTLHLTATEKVGGTSILSTTDDAIIIVSDETSRTYTRNVDFSEGSLFNLNFNEVPDELRLNKNITPLPYIYIACSERGTVVRIDINSGQIVGEYATAPGSAADRKGKVWPSRLAVDSKGNVWVANSGDRWVDPADSIAKSSIARIGVVIGGTRGHKVGSTFVPDPNGDYLAPPFIYNTCVDRHGTTTADPPDGLIKTSRGRRVGFEDIRSWNNSGGVDSDGGVATAEDEGILNFVRVQPTGTGE